MNRIFPKLSRDSIESYKLSMLGHAIGNTRGLLTGSVPPRAGVLVITCSDLRGDPFSVIDKRFPTCVLQNFGNLVEHSNFDVASPVEVTMALSPISDILVLGHTPCDFMDRMILGPGPTPSGCTHLRDASLTELRHLAHSRWKQGLRLSNQECAEFNVRFQLEQLMRLTGVSHQLRAGEVVLHGAIVVGQKIMWLRPT